MEQRCVDDLHLRDAANLPLEREARLFGEAAAPAALSLIGNEIETARDVGGSLLAALLVRQEIGIERAGDRSLLDHAVVIARVQAVEDRADLPRLVEYCAKIGTCQLFAGAKHQRRLGKTR